MSIMRAVTCAGIVALQLAAPAAVLWAGDAPAAIVSLGQPKERRLAETGDHPNHLFREQTATFDLGDLTYAIGYKACVDEAHGDQVAPLEGYLGMPRPCSCNWYHGGFLAVIVNGHDIGTTRLSSMMVVENGARAVLDMVWHDPLADVRVRIVGLPGADHLICDIALDPRQEIESVALALRCYPSYFTSYHHRDGARRIQTPAELVEQGQNVTLPAAENWWALYYDEIFDVALGEGEGPCALLIPSDEATEVRFAPGGYSVETAITYPPDTRQMRLAVWDFKGVTNADALARMRACADEVLAELGQDFTPPSLTEFDFAAARDEINKVLANPQGREALGEQADEVERWLAERAPAVEHGAQGASVSDEEQLLQSIDRFNDLKWQVRIIGLLYEL